MTRITRSVGRHLLSGGWPEGEGRYNKRTIAKAERGQVMRRFFMEERI